MVDMLVDMVAVDLGLVEEGSVYGRWKTFDTMTKRADS